MAKALALTHAHTRVYMNTHTAEQIPFGIYTVFMSRGAKPLIRTHAHTHTDDESHAQAR